MLKESLSGKAAGIFVLAFCAGVAACDDSSQASGGESCPDGTRADVAGTCRETCDEPTACSDPCAECDGGLCYAGPDCCVDNDGDGYGQGSLCAGLDCDDTAVACTTDCATNTDNDGVVDCLEDCPADPDKTEAGTCGCGIADDDGDGDGIADCVDVCPADSNKSDPGWCGCGNAETPTCSVGPGDGSDGDLVVHANETIDLSAGVGEVFPVAGIGTSSVTVNGAGSAGTEAADMSNVLAAGDRVLLLNLGGDSADYASAGTYELLEVTGVVVGAGGTVVPFSGSVTGTYGVGGNGDLTGQRVVLQRLPQFANVTVEAGGTLTASEWNSSAGGVLAFMASGRVDVQGLIDMSGRGYRGGAEGPQDVPRDGFAGESYGGAGEQGIAASLGGGGGGFGDLATGGYRGVGGGGAGYAVDGQPATSSGPSIHETGEAGAAYGDAELTALFLGSGGGGGGTDNNPNHLGGAGGDGGGIILIRAGSLRVDGQVLADGDDGIRAAAYAGGSGGGGAGGSISIVAERLLAGAEKIRARGGVGLPSPGQSGDSYGIGGNGANGRIALTCGHIDAVTWPRAARATNAGPSSCREVVANGGSTAGESTLKIGSRDVSVWCDPANGGMARAVKNGDAWYPVDCKAALELSPPYGTGSTAANGVYVIDPNGPTAGGTVSVYCDMTTDGGGWTFVAHVNGDANAAEVTELFGQPVGTYRSDLVDDDTTYSLGLLDELDDTEAMVVLDTSDPVAAVSSSQIATFKYAVDHPGFHTGPLPCRGLAQPFEIVDSSATVNDASAYVCSSAAWYPRLKASSTYGVLFRSGDEPTGYGNYWGEGVGGDNTWNHDGWWFVR